MPVNSTELVISLTTRQKYSRGCLTVAILYYGIEKKMAVASLYNQVHENNESADSIFRGSNSR